MSGHTAVSITPRATAGRRAAVALAGLWYLGWKMLLSALCKLLFRYRVEGRQYEPRSGPLIVAANHASAIDPPLIGIALRRRAAYMAKAELFAVPILGAWLRSIGVFPVRREQPGPSTFRRSLDILAAGGVVVMFPEGTRSPDGRLKDPEPGAARIALRTGVPVLPVAAVGSHRILPKGTRLPRLQRLIIRMGPPMAIPKIEGRLDHEVQEAWGGRIMEAIAKLLPPEQRGNW